MKAQEIASNSIGSTDYQIGDDLPSIHRSSRYQKVLDGRKQPVRGLWIRNGKYIARLRLKNPVTGKKCVKWMPLKDENGTPIALIGAAKTALRKLMASRDRGEMHAVGRTPKFSDFMKDYWAEVDRRNQAMLSSGMTNRVKRPATIAKERGALAMWTEHLGETRVGDIADRQLEDFINRRQSDGVSNRTIMLDLIALRNVLKLAIKKKHIRVLPSIDRDNLRWSTPRRDLVTLADIENLCESAVHVSKNGQQFSDYLLLMAFCGSRRDETLRLRWTDVKWELNYIEIGADGLSKNGKPRFVDFNSQLETHLKGMFNRRAPDSQWLFPSPQRGQHDDRAMTFRETLTLARSASGYICKGCGKITFETSEETKCSHCQCARLEFNQHVLSSRLQKFGFHDCRHFFISMCVMAGIDYMTIAEWVGHQDGGILIGKVYGHLADEHRKQMAQKVVFTPKVLKDDAASNG